jgi:predicted amidohydrolase YtcJ
MLVNKLGTYTLLLTLFCSCKFRQKIPLLVHHAKIYTVDERFSIAEAMAISDGKIVAIGTNDEILKAYEGEEELNAAGKTIYPGFIDAHCHFTGFATDMWKCNLVGTKSFNEVIDKMNEFSKTAPLQWLYGRGWDQNDWEQKEFPSKEKLDSIFPNRPVFLKRIDGHAALANQKALDLAQINGSTTITGGNIELKNGKPTGILIDNAMDLVEHIIPAISDTTAKKYFNDAQNICFALGLTGVQDCGISEHTVDLIDAEQKAGNLKMKIYAMLTDSAQYYNKWIAKGIYKTALLHVGGFKLYGDGALGSRGACLIQDYSDKPGWKGFLLSDAKHFREVAAKLVNTKFQMCTYAEVLKGKNDKRWRIEHAQVVNEHDFNLFGNYNIIPSVQPTHATSDMYWADKRLGSERIKNAYAYKKLLQQNGWMPLGTDFPVEDISPFKTFFAAVVRQDDKGLPAQGFQIENALTREETLKGMTIWAAKAAFEENEKGSLEKGKAADFILLDTDLITADIKNLLKATVNETYINGKPVYKKNK